MVDLLRKSSFLLFNKLQFCTMTPRKKGCICIFFSWLFLFNLTQHLRRSTFSRAKRELTAKFAPAQTCHFTRACEGKISNQGSRWFNVQIRNASISSGGAKKFRTRECAEFLLFTFSLFTFH